MPVKGAKCLVIDAVTLTGRSCPSNIHLIFNFWPPFCYILLHILYNFLNKKHVDITTLTKINHGFIVVKLLNFRLRDF